MIKIEHREVMVDGQLESSNHVISLMIPYMGAEDRMISALVLNDKEFEELKSKISYQQQNDQA